MKRSVISIFVGFAPLLSISGQDARDIAREMGSNTTSSVSAGTDRYDLHKDTQTVQQPRAHATSVLQSAQQASGKKLSPSEKKRLRATRQKLLNEKKAAADAAAAVARQASGPESRFSASTTTKRAGAAMEETTPSSETAAKEAAARKRAERLWDLRRGKEVKAIDQVLQEGGSGKDVRFHATSVLDSDR